ncbi:MAG: DUF1847 domain-containing protein [Succinivibrionaceae bacterium]|jgi:uncharacterized metal-binding protein|nr:DUF1847 domain-containing protein [Succinivibrionaceae bacterium]
MTTNTSHTCESCTLAACRFKNEAKYPKYCLTANADQDLVDETITIYKENKELGDIARISASIEGEFYGRYTRVEETIEFIKRMGYKKIGIATCVGLLGESRILSRILAAHGIESYVVGCKTGAVDKTEIGVPNELKLNKGCGHESLCNPILQAKILEKEQTDFNIVMGLCIGHDTLFLKYSAVPTTVLVVKDRVLGHNPVQALYMANTIYSKFKKELNIK